MGISFDGGTATGFTTEKGEASNLTFDKLMETMAELRKPKLYYAVNELLPQGDCYWLEAGDFHPEYVIVHPDDLERIKDELSPYRTLLPLADYQPSMRALWPRRNEGINEKMWGLPEAEVDELRQKMVDILLGK